MLGMSAVITYGLGVGLDDQEVLGGSQNVAVIIIEVDNDLQLLSRLLTRLGLQAIGRTNSPGVARVLEVLGNRGNLSTTLSGDDHRVMVSALDLLGDLEKSTL